MEATVKKTPAKKKRALNIDNPVFAFMGRLGDLVVLNILWLLCCIPVITAGAATVGLFTVVNKLAAGDEFSLWKDFFKALKRDFKQATVLWFVLLAAVVVGMIGLRLGGEGNTAQSGLITAASFLLLAAVCCCGCWAFALLARFTYPHALLPILDGARMITANLLPTVGIAALLIWPAMLWVLAPDWFIYLLLPIFLIGGSASALGMAALMRPAFARMEKTR